MRKQTRVLVIDDSRFFRSLVSKSISERIGAEVVVAETFSQTRSFIESSQESFDVALVGLVLPDAPDGEAVDYLLEMNVPCIVFTGTFSPEIRTRLLAHNVVDYVVKDTPSSLDYIVDLTEQLHNNKDRKVLVVDDSSAARHYICSQLKTYGLEPLEANDGDVGLQILQENPDIQLVVTDYNMPNMDGVEMIRRMRKTHGRDSLIIIALSAADDAMLSASFIKNGANDYLRKPFEREEFLCRVMQNLRMLDMLKLLRDMVIKDVLTGLHNRRYLFECGEALFASASREQISLTVVMLDIDHFKSVNDTYGHDGGDKILKTVAKVLQDGCRKTDIIARVGGEEFCCVAVDMADDYVETFFNSLREKLANTSVECDGKQLSVTASFGVCHGVRDSLEGMLKVADEKLYDAKHNGRNRVEVSWPPEGRCLS